MRPCEFCSYDHVSYSGDDEDDCDGLCVCVCVCVEGKSKQQTSPAAVYKMKLFVGQTAAT